MSGLDVLVLGSGIAGLSAAMGAVDAGLRVGLVSKAPLDLATTRWAQGGVAAALSGDVEEVDLHLADTLKAGGGLCDIEAVRILVDEGPGRVHQLIARGAVFDRDEAGQLELAREGGHSVARVIHAGGAATGAEIERALVAAFRAAAAEVHEGTFAHELLQDADGCVGVSVSGPDGSIRDLRARHVILATGGAGQLFAVTTNPPVATGDGVAMALRAGAAVADLEFFQFHPTALDLPTMPRPLLSEALRGHGALLRDGNGQRFVDELLPRDVVSRAITKVMADQHLERVWLDATGLDHFGLRFPTIAADIHRAGLDPATDWLPVAPAAHHQCGGIVVDLDGATSIPRLWAVGETSCTGVHGANRLASNSLLEGMVFGARSVEAIVAGQVGARHTGAMRSLGSGPAHDVAPTDTVVGGRVLPAVDLPDSRGDDPAPDLVAGMRRELQRAMSNHAAVIRSAASLESARLVAADVLARTPSGSPAPPVAELRNLAEIAMALLAGAEARQESRGAHSRSDFCDAHDEFRIRLISGTRRAT